MKAKILPSIKGQKVIDGQMIMEIESWEDFDHLIKNDLLDTKEFIFRGQRDSSWSLLSSLRRQISLDNDFEKIQTKLLQNFKKNSRGLLDVYTRNILDTTNTEWWMLGQHFGLYTPLLDWSESPYVALFFSFFEESAQSNSRSVYALSKTISSKISKEKLEILDSQFDFNKRLLSQNGILTMSKDGNDIETIITENYKKINDEVVLIKINIKEQSGDRKSCLAYLDRMNINYLRLFPELNGAAVYSNLEIKNSS